jgi:proliferating cell nuclear antigen
MSETESSDHGPGASATTVGADSADQYAVRAIVDAATLDPVLAAIDSVVTECRLHFEPEGLRVVASDPAHVALTTVELDAAAFASYDADGTTVGMNVERFDEIVGMADSDQPISLAVDRETWTLDIRIGELSYTMALLDPESVQRPPDRSEMDFPYAASLTLDSAEIDRFVRAVDMVADYVTVAVDPAEPSFVVSAEGDTDEVSFVLSDDELAAFSPGDAESLFSLGYVADVSGAIPSGTAVELQLGTECPVQLDYEIADGDGAVEALVSPRIQR